ncbi:hypothetical protein BASA83_004512 [Batrachochytrium salamandrivorans]|nr:hypothetical protein BASA83_004512 [Batrachochytrium salamandrivorans]
MSPSPKIIVPSPRQASTSAYPSAEAVSHITLETGSVNSVHISARKHDDVPEVRSNAALYVPFQLSAKSSFKPYGHDCTAAKSYGFSYKAKYRHMKPHQHMLLRQIRHSEQRSHRWLTSRA